MLFKLATAYVGVAPRREWSWSIPHELGSGSVFPHFVNDLTAFCATHQVNYILIGTAGLFNALVLGWVSPKCNTLMQTAVG
jgi:hypothetical protein